MKSKSGKIFATLVRGQDYVLVNRHGGKDKQFLRGQPVEITPEEHDWLKLHAVDRVTCLAVEGDEIVPVTGKVDGDAFGGTVSKDVPKFKFTTETEQAA